MVYANPHALWSQASSSRARLRQVGVRDLNACEMGSSHIGGMFSS